MKVDLIPALEISAPAIVWQLVGPHPLGHFLENPLEWEKYQVRILQVAGFADYKRVIKGSHFLSIDDWSLLDLRRLIGWHLQPEEEQIPVAESCALFGGGVLFIDDEPVPIPQCCSTIDDIYSYQELVRPDFISGYFCNEGHPNPKATRYGDELIVICEEQEQEESFNQPALPNFFVELPALTSAIAKAQQEMQKFCGQVDLLSAEFGVQKLSDHLVLGK